MYLYKCKRKNAQRIECPKGQRKYSFFLFPIESKNLYKIQTAFFCPLKNEFSNYSFKWWHLLLLKIFVRNNQMRFLIGSIIKTWLRLFIHDVIIIPCFHLFQAKGSWYLVMFKVPQLHSPATWFFTLLFTLIYLDTLYRIISHLTSFLEWADKKIHHP